MTISIHSIVRTLKGDCFASDLIGKSEPTSVITWDGERVTVGKITVERPLLQVPLKMELDDGSELFVSGGAELITRSGDKLKVRDAEAGLSLMPFYSKVDSSGYPIYREPGEWNRAALTTRDGYNWRPISRMVAESILGRRCAPGDRVSHTNGDKMDCSLDNIVIETRNQSPHQQTASFAEPIFKAQRLISKLNHRLDKIQVDISREMLLIKGIATSNFAVGGIFIVVDSEQ